MQRALLVRQVQPVLQEQPEQPVQLDLMARLAQQGQPEQRVRQEQQVLLMLTQEQFLSLELSRERLALRKFPMLSQVWQQERVTFSTL